MTERPTKILMLGTSPKTKGGVASVIKTYQESGLFSRWPITYLPTHVDGSLRKKFVSALCAWASFAGWLMREGHFILHVNSASGPSFWRKFLFMLPAFWTGTPVIFHLHGGGFMQFYDKNCNPVSKRIVRYTLNRCAKIIVLSKEWLESVSTITENNQIVIVPNTAVSVVDVMQKKPSHPASILFLGRLCWNKGVYDLLEAFSHILQSHPNARLICAGDGEIGKCRRVAAELRLGNSVEFPGWVGDARRSELLSEASIYVLPSYMEGSPISILEAMSAGLPVVASSVGGIPDLVTDRSEGFLIAPGDPVALKRRICALLEDSELREKMATKAKSKYEEYFSVNSVIPKLEKVYRELGVLPRRAY
jgi:glycosyltransferase involved in cell wall biosynthesis